MSDRLKGKLYYSEDENKDLHFQRAEYIEDGWFIIEKNNKFEVWEIPEFGGQEHPEGTFKTLKEALKKALSFC